MKTHSELCEKNNANFLKLLLKNYCKLHEIILEKNTNFGKQSRKKCNKFCQKIPEIHRKFCQKIAVKKACSSKNKVKLSWKNLNYLN